MAEETKPDEAPRGIAFAVSDYLAGLRMSPSERVMGALALMLAESLEAAPVYARAPLAGRLHDVMLRLADVEVSPENLSLLQGLDL